VDDWPTFEHRLWTSMKIYNNEIFLCMNNSNNIRILKVTWKFKQQNVWDREVIYFFHARRCDFCHYTAIRRANSTVKRTVKNTSHVKLNINLFLHVKEYSSEHQNSQKTSPYKFRFSKAEEWVPTEKDKVQWFVNDRAKIHKYGNNEVW
jgi:hypothetical protein